MSSDSRQQRSPQGIAQVNLHLTLPPPGENQHLQLDKESLGDSYAMAREKRHEQRQQTTEGSIGHSTSEPPHDTVGVGWGGVGWAGVGWGGLFVRLFVCWFVCSFVRLFVCCLLVCLFACSFVYLLFVCLFVCLLVCLFVCLFV